MFDFRNYSATELNELVQADKSTRINLILDEQAVDFLLGLVPDGKRPDEIRVGEIARNIEDVVLQTVGTINVTDSRLDDGLDCLEAIRDLGYPESLVATVVFGADQQQQ